MKSAVVSRIFICLLAMAPLLGIFAALGEATLLAVAALLAIAAAPRACWTLIRREKILVGLLIALAAWAAASAVWSILPLHSFIEGVRFLTLSATGLFVVAAAGALAPEDRQRLVRWVAIGMIAAVAVFAADWLSGWPLLRRLSGLPADSMVRLERFDRGTTVLGLLLWPIAFHLKRRGQTLLLIGVVAAVALAFAIIPSSTNRLALIVGIAVCAVAWLRPRLMAAGIVAIMVLVTFALPTAITKLLPTNESIVQLHDDVPGIKFTALHRLLIWRFVADRVAEREAEPPRLDHLDRFIRVVLPAVVAGMINSAHSSISAWRVASSVSAAGMMPLT